jgi:lysophospholipase L1-like esterase
MDAIRPIAFLAETAMIHLRRLLCGLVALAALGAAASAARADFPLKDGDIWVMAGDSITAQHLHSNYFEAFCYARYPKLKFGFRNSGVGGHTIPSTLARFDYDIAAWKPTVVSVELGMNDKGGTPTDKFIANMDTMVQRIRATKARPVIFAPSPVNNGETLAMLASNKRLHEYADALKEFCAKQDIPYADQFHALLDVWGRNKMYEQIAALKTLAADDQLAGVEHLREFLAAQAKHPTKSVSMQGDAVHPGAPGQLMMAAALLKGLGADPFVSNAGIDVTNKQADAQNCTVDALEFGDGKVAFDRLDRCLPFPIPDDARSVVGFDPTILAMSKYTLKVTGLASGNYNLSVNGAALGTVSAKDLAAGINLTSFGPATKGKAANPIAAQGKAILDAVAARAGLVGQWRNQSKAAHAKDAPADAMAKLAEMTKRVEEGDERIREAAVPRKLHFELTHVP